MFNNHTVNVLAALFYFVLFVGTSAAQKINATRIVWEKATELPSYQQTGQPGLAGAYSGISNNFLIVAGGANFPEKMPWDGGEKMYHQTIYLAKRTEDGNIVWQDDPGVRLPEATGYGGTASLPEGIVCVGGETADGPVSTVFLLNVNPTTGKISLNLLPDLPIPLTALSVSHIGSTVYVFGGLSKNGASNSSFSIDLQDLHPSWEELPPAPVAFSHAAVAAQSNGEYSCLYIMGGRRPMPGNPSEIFSHTLRYDPRKKEWHKGSPIGSSEQPSPRAAATAIVTGANYIFLIGGDDGRLFNQLETYDLAISEAGKELVRERLVKKKKELLENHPGFSREVWMYNTVTDIWAQVDKIPYETPVTTSAVKWGKDIFIPSGEVRPGVRTPAVLKGSIPVQHRFSWIDSLVLLLSFLLMTIGRYAFTGKSDSTYDYFKGGQRIPQWAAAVSIFGAKLSAITFMGIPAKTYATNWTYFFLLMTIVMVMPFVAKYFVPFYRQLNVTSAYEYLSRRFNEATRLIASSLYILLQLGRIAIVVLLPSIALTLVTGINVNLCIFLIGAISIFFTVKGGIEAVIWVEVIQVLVLAAGALACLVYIPTQISDWNEAFQALETYDKLKVFDFRFSFTEPTFWVVLIGGFAIQFLTYGTDQTTVQRYLTTKTEKESVNSLRIGAWLTVPSTLVFFTLGTLLYVFFRENPLEVNPGLDNQDNIFPWFIVSQLPAGLSGLLIAGVFAASMSSTEASMNSTATLLANDFYRKWYPEAGERSVLRFARIATLGLGIFATCVALYMAHVGVSSLWDSFNTVLGLFTGCIGGAFLLGVFTKRANSSGVMAGMICSGLTQVGIQYFTEIHLLMYAFTGLFTCVVFGYIFSFILSKKEGRVRH